MKKISKKLLFIGLCSLTIYSCTSPEDQEWEHAIHQYSLEAIDSFFDKYPNSKYRAEEDKQKEVIYWTKADASKTVFFFKDYISKYPEGAHLDIANQAIDSIRREKVDLSNLSIGTFSGKVDYGNREMGIMSFKFARIEQSDEEIRFLGTINTADIRKEIQGTIDTKTYKIFFQEEQSDKVFLNLSEGRVYPRDGKLIMESTDIQQYWKLSNFQ